MTLCKTCKTDRTPYPYPVAAGGIQGRCEVCDRFLEWLELPRSGKGKK